MYKRQGQANANVSGNGFGHISISDWLRDRHGIVFPVNTWIALWWAMPALQLNWDANPASSVVGLTDTTLWVSLGSGVFVPKVTAGDTAAMFNAEIAQFIDQTNPGNTPQDNIIPATPGTATNPSTFAYNPPFSYALRRLTDGAVNFLSLIHI